MATKKATKAECTMRNYSKISKDWWDYTTIDESLVRDVARLALKDLEQLTVARDD